MSKKVLMESVNSRSGILSLVFEVVKNIVLFRKENEINSIQDKRLATLEKEFRTYVDIIKTIIPATDDRLPKYYLMDDEQENPFLDVNGDLLPSGNQTSEEAVK